MAVQVSVLGSYLPPVLKHVLALYPPQMIISLPVQTAVWSVRASGVLVVLVGVQVSSVHVPGGSCYCWKHIADPRFCQRLFSAAFVTVTTVFVCCNSVISRCASTGRARHSAMTDGSSPSA